MERMQDSQAAPRSRWQARRTMGPFEATRHAAVHLVLWGPVLVLLIVNATSLGLVAAFGLGLPLLAVTVPLTAQVADTHRRRASQGLGEPVAPLYRPTEDLAFIQRLRAWAMDPARWRDQVWTFVAASVGCAASAIVVALPLAVVFELLFPLLHHQWPGVFNAVLGFIPAEDLTTAWVASWTLALLYALLWVFIAGPLMRVRLRLDAELLSEPWSDVLARRVEEVVESRSDSLDLSAAELRRIERDLHDGPQARIAALAMTLGLADDLMEHDPEAARALLAEARDTAGGALGDLRDVVRGIHPPVLADRGLVGAVQALARDLPLPVDVVDDVGHRLPAPVESAAYFAVAEALANTVKHAHATQASVHLAHRDEVLHVEVQDDGVGGADPAGSGIRGVARRLSAFDGTLDVTSPDGGPTKVTMEVPCASSSLKTTPSSEMGSSAS